MPSSTGAPLILASGSPRRLELLRRLAIPFEVAPSGVDEDSGGEREPEIVVRRLARAKAEAAASGRAAGLVLGFDTVVVLDGEIIGKPRDAGEARATLRRLRARAHTVYTGLTLVDIGAGHTYSSAVTTTVVMRAFGDAALNGYVATGEPMDKAGSYAAQGAGAALIAAIDGCWTNVVGLPLCELARLFRLAGMTAAEPDRRCVDPAGHPCPRLPAGIRDAAATGVR
jgi:septum formation protein